MAEINDVWVTQKEGCPKTLFVEQPFCTVDEEGTVYTLFHNGELLCELVETYTSQYVKFYCRRKMNPTAITKAFNWFKDETMWVATQNVLREYIRKHKSTYQALVHARTLDLTKSGFVSITEN